MWVMTLYGVEANKVAGLRRFLIVAWVRLANQKIYQAIGIWEMW
jgi:hypothetical protein